MFYWKFCEEQSIARHLQDQSSGEDEVKLLQSHSVKDKPLKLDEPRGKVDFYCNMKVLHTGGELEVWIRPLSEMRVLSTDYLPCQRYQIFFTEAELWRTRKRFHLKKYSDSRDVVKRPLIAIYSSQYWERGTEELKSRVLQKINMTALNQLPGKISLF